MVRAAATDFVIGNIIDNVYVYVNSPGDGLSGATFMQTAIARKLDSLKTRGGIKFADLAELLNTTPETVSRWNSGRSSPRSDTERKILELEYIVERLREFYDDPEDARLWLYTPQKLLGGQKPADLIEAGRIDEVRAFINELSGTVYS